MYMNILKVDGIQCINNKPENPDNQSSYKSVSITVKLPTNTSTVAISQLYVCLKKIFPFSQPRGMFL